MGMVRHARSHRRRRATRASSIPPCGHRLFLGRPDQLAERIAAGAAVLTTETTVASDLTDPRRPPRRVASSARSGGPAAPPLCRPWRRTSPNSAPRSMRTWLRERQTSRPVTVAESYGLTPTSSAPDRSTCASADHDARAWMGSENRFHRTGPAGPSSSWRTSPCTRPTWSPATDCAPGSWGRPTPMPHQRRCSMLRTRPARRSARTPRGHRSSRRDTRAGMYQLSPGGDGRRAAGDRLRGGGEDATTIETLPSPTIGPHSAWSRVNPWPTRSRGTPGGRPKVMAVASPRCW